ncbi:hypothetical protein SELMODRAFT_424964 [Selaginella moellendorffii]|uniref:Uncharacterized protein n=1 Tax=Selaginella moellendorffii TaxID=88036 RepID=D8SRK1_SELML|nr:hypothetical protein SELMODRAFT_424964 [Selaginella moellendorffii]
MAPSRKLVLAALLSCLLITAAFATSGDKDASLLAEQGQALNGRKLLGEVHTSDYDGPKANRNPHYGAPPPLGEYQIRQKSRLKGLTNLVEPRVGLYIANFPVILLRRNGTDIAFANGHGIKLTYSKPRFPRAIAIEQDLFQLNKLIRSWAPVMKPEFRNHEPSPGTILLSQILGRGHPLPCRTAHN